MTTTKRFGRKQVRLLGIILAMSFALTGCVAQDADKAGREYLTEQVSAFEQGLPAAPRRAGSATSVWDEISQGEIVDQTALGPGERLPENTDAVNVYSRIDDGQQVAIGVYAAIDGKTGSGITEDDTMQHVCILYTFDLQDGAFIRQDDECPAGATNPNSEQVNVDSIETSK